MPGHRGDAFGQGSPPVCLAFHDGNATAAEICTYCPHWIKSVNVVDRFITNGGAQRSIAAMINEFRNVPMGAEFTPNSAQIMMSNNMRRAGYLGWTVGKHQSFNRPKGNVGPDDLYIGHFSTPWDTHPTHQTSGPVPGVPFVRLGQHVKKHPSGDDALDLARCVQYAMIHHQVPYEFPRDFKLLTDRLGGPATVTANHLDRQAFTRRSDWPFTSSIKKPAAQSVEKRRSQHHTEDHEDGIKEEDDITITQLGQFDMMGANDRRKSGRLATRAATNMREYDSDATDVDNTNTPYAGNATPIKKRKLSRIPPTPGSPNDSDFAAEVSEVEDDFQDGELASGDEDLFSPARGEKKRAAANKARQVIHDLTTETQRNISALKHKRSVQSSRAAAPIVVQSVSATTFWDGKPRPAGAPIPVMPIPADLAALGATRVPLAVVNEQILTQARTYDPTAMPICLNPPNLGGPNDYVSIDETNIHLFAAEGCTTEEELWLSAFSYDRFKGPRRHPPFRELYRIVGPDEHDISDFAENIRWAKQQNMYYGIKTWREYDYDLEVIKEHRVSTNWVSEAKIMYGSYTAPSLEYEGYPY